MRRWSVALIGGLLSACGLVTSDPSDPSGTAGAAGSGGAAGFAGASGAAGVAGSAGAAPVVCNKLVRAGAPVQVAFGEVAAPSLVSFGNSVELVAQSTEIRTWHWSNPWQAEPFAAPEGGKAIALAGPNNFAASADTAQSSAVVLHHGDATLPDAPCVQLTKVSPASETVATVGDCTSTNVHMFADVVVAGAPGSGSYAIMFGPSGWRKLTRITNGKVKELPRQFCADVQMSGTGWYTPAQGFFFAATGSTPLGVCNGTAPIGTPDRLQVVRLDENAFVPELRYELELDQRIYWPVAAALADGGAWLVFQERVEEHVAELNAVRLDATGAPVGAPMLVAKLNDGYATALAPLGERTVLALYDGAGMLRFQFLDEATTPSTPAFHLEPAEPPSTVTLASSPNGDSVIAAWASYPDGLRAIRLDCAE